MFSGGELRPSYSRHELLKSDLYYFCVYIFLVSFHWNFVFKKLNQFFLPICMCMCVCIHECMCTHAGPPSENPGPWAERSRALSYRALLYWALSYLILTMLTVGPAGPLKVAGPLGICPPPCPPSRRACTVYTCIYVYIFIVCCLNYQLYFTFSVWRCACMVLCIFCSINYSVHPYLFKLTWYHFPSH